MQQNSSTPLSQRLHIAFIGCCNSGKSSLINKIAGQSISIVSEIAGTTTDPVLKAIELPGIGASVLIDTPGIDDQSELGEQRIAKTRDILNRTDIAVLVFKKINDDIVKWHSLLEKRKIPIIAAITHCDVNKNINHDIAESSDKLKCQPIRLSSVTSEGIDILINEIDKVIDIERQTLTYHLCNDGDTVMLVMPQDDQAPKGRLIKPQVETLRELLDRNCNIICCTPANLEKSLESLAVSPHLVITDSQVFRKVHDTLTAKNKPFRLTSFSVLFAKQKGDIHEFVKGAQIMLTLPGNAHILIAEACSHIPKNEDIGRVKLPRLLRQKLGEDLKIDITGGNDFPDDLSCYDLVIHCGACMFNRKHVMSRISQAQDQAIPITNYGIAIAALTGILDQITY